MLLTVVFGLSLEARADLRTVFLAPVPVIFDFNVTVEAGTIDDTRRIAAAEYLSRFDVDKDGLLSREEAVEMNPLPGDRKMTVETLWSRVDTSPADKYLSEDEILALINEAVGPDIILEKVEGKSLNDLALEEFLDSNTDGKIEASEYAVGFERLRRVDFDDDDTLSAAELIAYAKATEASGERPMPMSTASKSSLPRQLAELSQSTSGESWHERRWRELDANEDGEITAAEAKAWVETADADLLIRLDISRTFGNRIKTEIGPSRLKPARPVKSRRSRSTTKATVGPPGNQTAIEFRVPKKMTAADGKSFLKIQHIKADADQNGYLTSGEYAGGFDQKPGTFDDIDRNNDKMMFIDELELFIDRKQTMAQLQVKLSVENVSQSLFDMIDSDVDQRLSPREIYLLAGADRKADSMATAYRVSATIDEIEFVAEETMSMASRALPRVREQSVGPEWFRKMDRNQDGDLTWREFLGPRDAFEQLDQDQDGFVSPGEADKSGV